MDTADDIDDLLNEVESKFLTSGGKQPTQQPSHSQRLSNTSKSKRTERGITSHNDLEETIKEILEDSDKGTPHRDTQLRHSSEPNCTDRTKASNLAELHHKCHPVYLGGSRDAKGLGTTINKRVCDKLRCTNCDFYVAAFDDYKWHPSTDYLFLRNNMPDFDKLRSKLVSKRGEIPYRHIFFRPWDP
ncbi:hypothetical protein NP493_199g06069 [Ridgeia piscesae]|uniref:Cilia- and flagella-associated protein 418 n=1 Tax=Ridgeia piscesae TaxID=27915 RepID=A0AAD9P1I4_RIDPI|nr:hypothetical protein NP493_199g06069 [Ridgeia piscesae]